jgi:hypothetical protein
MSKLRNKLDKEWFVELNEEVEGALQQLLHDVKEFYDKSVVNSNFEYNEDDKWFDYPLQADLYKLYKYIRGEKEKPDNFKEIISRIKRLVWTNRFLPNKEYGISWKDWEDTKLGKLISIAMAKSKYDKQEVLTPKEIGLLTDVSANAVRRRLYRESIVGEKIGGEWEVKPEEYNKIINL